MQVVPSLHFGGNTYQMNLNDRYTNQSLCPAGKLKVRIMVRRDRSEVYVNERCLFNVGFRDMLPEGGFSILAENGDVNLTHLEIDELKPL